MDLISYYVVDLMFLLFTKCHRKMRIIKHSEVLRMFSKIKLKVRENNVFCLIFCVLKTAIASYFRNLSSKACIILYSICHAEYLLLIKSKENCVYISIHIFKALIESLEKCY